MWFSFGVLVVRPDVLVLVQMSWAHHCCLPPTSLYRPTFLLSVKLRWCFESYGYFLSHYTLHYWLLVVSRSDALQKLTFSSPTFYFLKHYAASWPWHDLEPSPSVTYDTDHLIINSRLDRAQPWDRRTDRQTDLRIHNAVSSTEGRTINNSIQADKRHKRHYDNQWTSKEVK